MRVPSSLLSPSVCLSLSLFPLLKKTHESRYSSRRNQKRRPKNEERRRGNWNGKLFTTQQNRKKTQAHTRYLPLLLLLFLIPRGSSRKMNWLVAGDGSQSAVKTMHNNVTQVLILIGIVSIALMGWWATATHPQSETDGRQLLSAYIFPFSLCSRAPHPVYDEDDSSPFALLRSRCGAVQCSARRQQMALRTLRSIEPLPGWWWRDRVA